MYLLSIHIHEYSRILLTKQRIFAINICTNVNISFEVLVNIHIREYIFVVFSTSSFPSQHRYNNCLYTHICSIQTQYGCTLGRHAGKKVVVINQLDKGTKQQLYLHGIVASIIECYPYKLTCRTGQKFAHKSWAQQQRCSQHSMQQENAKKMIKRLDATLRARTGGSALFCR
ncbi:hypothetical protein K438DRAFT_1570446 [Mycena galopus ATCC 62051]|nr:hypothetical protein K438DRAFT_1570446 [Mycena galopus ATCC 62051]